MVYITAVNRQPEVTMADQRTRKFVLDRRALLRDSLIGGGAALMYPWFAAGFQHTASAKPGVASRPVADTTAGKIRGAFANGIFVFKGVPYGASTAGSNRFMPPRKPEPWSGVRDALHYGHSAPQTIFGSKSLLGGLDFLAAGSDPPGIGEGEDCLVLNVWTPGLKDNGRRPVMVWCHGGAFISGSGSAPLCDGANLARRGDVVVVTLNHRLGALGYTYLGHAGGDAFAASGNAGMLDIVAALEWVRDNISEFGGDPRTVLIFGQSGGGQKVSTLLAMPPAKGFFHRAVIESGPGVRMNPLDYAIKVGDMFLAALDIKPDRIADIQTLPLERIMAAQGEVNRKLGAFIPGMIQGFSPVVDGVSLPQHPFDPVAPQVSAGIPLLIGFNRTELTLFAAGDPSLFSLDEAGLHKRVELLFGDRSEAVIRAFRSDYPQENPSGLYFLIASAYPTVAYTAKIAERRAALRKAPTFVYEFTWETPILGGRLKTPHTLEIPFVFDNVRDPLVQKLTGDGPEIFPLAKAVSGAWTAFATNGVPDSQEFPRWLPYSAADRNVMIINTHRQLEKDPDRNARVAVENILFPPRG
jgi:para-nitrobenzyl esterase